MSYNPNIPHLQVGYNLFSNHLLTSWDIQVDNLFNLMKGPILTLLGRNFQKPVLQIFVDIFVHLKTASWWPDSRHQPVIFSNDNCGVQSPPQLTILVPLHLRKLTWNLKMPPWKRKHIYKPPIFWVPYYFRVCIYTSQIG